MTKRIILFASGNGSNVEQICHFFEQDKLVSIAAVYSNNPKAGVIQRMEPFGINVKVFDKKSFIDGTLLGEIISLNPDLIILAGFLWKIGSEWTASFPQKIINIHPALLPSYGGKGMYGMNVHKAVKENKASKTGITIHYVNNEYDQGGIIFQEEVSLDQEDSPEEIAGKVYKLEHLYFAPVISKLLRKSENEG